MQNSEPGLFDNAPRSPSARGVGESNGAPASSAPPTLGSADAHAYARAAPGSTHRTSDSLFEFGGEAIDATRRLFDVLADRAGLAVRRSFLRTGMLIAAGACVALWLGASILAVFRGVCEGLVGVLGGRYWAGQLAGGLLGIGFALAVLLIALRIDSSRQLRRLTAKYRPNKSALEAAPAPVSPP